MTNISQWVLALRRYFEPIAYMNKRYPKAARRRRIQNKWRNRFGEDQRASDLTSQNNPFLALVERSND